MLYTEEDIPDISSLLVSGNKIWVGTYEGLYVIEKGEKARCLVDPDRNFTVYLKVLQVKYGLVAVPEDCIG